ncbi:MAG TPA: vitamin B12 dependent-methionine synthase activation domain-containing protein [Bryobacteraceae bacterium]|nr:vitamin B12 dependent-methionine synthase activation domain-containing protein [Bryobacteraceae bacterium]
MAEAKRPRRLPEPARKSWYAGLELVEAEESIRPLIVAERTNVIGSQLFKKLIAEEKWEEAAEIGRTQVRNGAHVVDVCLQSTERDELADIPPFYEQLIAKIKAPLMIDTTDPRRREAVMEAHRPGGGTLGEPAMTEVRDAAQELGRKIPRSGRVRTDIPIRAAPYLDRRVRDVPILAEVWSYVNPNMLYGRHLGYKGNFPKDLAEHQPKALQLFHRMEEVKEKAAQFLKVKAVWQFFPAERRGNAIALFRPGGAEPLHTFCFEREPRGNGLCLSDYLLDCEGAARDHLALFVVTAGAGVREKAEELKSTGEFFQAHALQALALETAEACAEWLHRRISALVFHHPDCAYFSVEGDSR